MQVEVVHADPQQQNIIQLDVVDGTTIAEAIKISGILRFVGADLRVGPDQNTRVGPVENLDCIPVGIFGKLRSLDWQLKEGDRVEIYRPLRVDPKVARLERAKKSRKKK